MITEDDWRLLGQDAYLTGVPLFFRQWSSDNPRWDHEHCAFCGAKFSDHIPDCLREGYTTADNYHWICPDCFADFRERFGWTLDVE